VCGGVLRVRSTVGDAESGKRRCALGVQDVRALASTSGGGKSTPSISRICPSKKSQQDSPTGRAGEVDSVIVVQDHPELYRSCFDSALTAISRDPPSD
jgi:hypothetical protein